MHLARRLISAIFILAFVAFTHSAHAGNGPAIYRGTWQSQTTGHQGPMRVKLTGQPDGSYRARFSGRFARVIPFTYRVSMSPAGEGMSGRRLVATKRIPIFGEFRTVANVSSNTVRASYSAKKDRGQFTMRRAR